MQVNTATCSAVQSNLDVVFETWFTTDFTLHAKKPRTRLQVDA